MSALVSRETRAAMDARMCWRSMPCMGKVHRDLQDVEDSFDDEPFSQENFFDEGHKIIFHIFPDPGNEFKSPAVKLLKERLRDKALVSKKAPFELYLEQIVHPHSQTLF